MSKRLNIREDFEVELNPNTIQDIQVSEAKQEDKNGKELPEKITTIVEAIHAGMTKNFTFYPAQNLEKSVGSWTRPYNKPVIKNHNVYEEPVGRVIDAEFKNSSIVADKQTIQLTLEISDPDTIKKVLDGRYQTLSIGGSTSSAICSACGKDLVKEGFCGHYKGRTYEGKKAHWIIGEMEFDEISWVNVPADANAQVIQKNVSGSVQESVEGGEDMPEEVQEHTNDILDQIDALRENVEQTDVETPEQITEEETPEAPESPEQVEEEVTVEKTPEGDNEEPTLEEQLAAAQDKITTLEADVETLKTEKQTLQDTVQTFEGEKTNLQEELDNTKSELATAEAETNKMLKQNISLASAAHRTLAESVVNLQVALGKVKEDEVEALYESLSKESARNLKEKVGELIKEKPQRIIQTVDRPGGEDLDDTTDSTHQQEKAKAITIVDLAERLEKVFNKTN